MAKLWNVLWCLYALAAVIVLAGALYGLVSHQPTRGLDCKAGAVSLADYAAFAAFHAGLWPAALYKDVVQNGVAPQDWIILHYDALGDACQWGKGS